MQLARAILEKSIETFTNPFYSILLALCPWLPDARQLRSNIKLTRQVLHVASHRAVPSVDLHISPYCPKTSGTHGPHLLAPERPSQPTLYNCISLRAFHLIPCISDTKCLLSSRKHLLSNISFYPELSCSGIAR